MASGEKRDKTFRLYSHRGDDEWVNRLECDPLLYQLPALAAASSEAIIVFCEGEKATEAAQSALDNATTDSWIVTTVSGSNGGATRADLTLLRGHRVVILQDADQRDPEYPDKATDAEKYAATIAQRAREAGARQVVILLLEDLPDHGDVVEWLATGHTGAELAQRIKTALATSTTPTATPVETSDDEMYRATPGGLRRLKLEEDKAGNLKRTLIPLTNFTARIVSDTLEDDGVETRRTFDMEATLCVGDLTRRYPRQFQLLAERFGVMSWPTEHLGAAAIVYPGQSTREHTRVAIQTLSGIVPERRVYTHTGWRQVDGEWVYLHAGGAIGAKGTRADVSVALSGDLARYELPTLSEALAQNDSEIVKATRASLRMLDVAPIIVTASIFAATYRAPLSNTDFAVHIGGQTGEGKSELAALAQQHYGLSMDARHLPASWSSTGNALEAQAFHAKDALLVVDDFIPTGTTVDAQRLHGVAERVLRAQGNHSGRQRMRADTSQRPTKPPRGLILSTGEDIPRGTSLRARMVVIEHAPGTMNWQKLSACQRDAASGRYALAMAAYVRWMASRYEAIQAEMRPQAIRETLADGLGKRTAHKRTSDNVAQLIAAMALFTRYALEIGAITEAEAETLQARVESALIHVGEQQAALQAQGEPTTRFLTLLNTAIMSGDAHLADKRGEHPGDTDAPWGWKLQTRGAGANMAVEWVSQGRKVGWLDGENLYILPDAAYAAAQRIGQASGDALAVTAGTLWKRLKERGFLLSWDAERQTNKKRVMVEGGNQNVLHLSTSALTSLSPENNPTNPTSDPDDTSIGATHIPNADGVTPDRRVLASGFEAESHNPTSDPTSARPDSIGVDEHLVGFVGFPAHKRVIRADVQQSSEANLSGVVQNPTENPTRKPDNTAKPDKRARGLSLAQALGWPRAQIAPHIGVSDERGWRDVLRRGSDADVSAALAWLTTHGKATAGGGAHAH